MYLTAPVVIIVWLRLNERVEIIYYLSISDNDYSNGTNRRTFIISRFEIYCCKIFHLFVLLVFVPHSFNLSGNFLAKPFGFEHFYILAIPKQFLLEVKLWTKIEGEDAIFFVSLYFFLRLVHFQVTDVIGLSC